MEKIYLLQIRMIFLDGNSQDTTIGYTTKQKALSAWIKEVCEFQIKYKVDKDLHNAIGDVLMNCQDVVAHFWVEELKIEE